MSMEVNKISEIYDGIYHVILDFPNQDIVLANIVDDNIPYVLLVEAKLGDETWKNFEIKGNDSWSIFSKKIQGDFIVKTEDFIKLNKNIFWMWAIQIESFPPVFFDFNKIKGKTKYDILKKINFNFILESQPGGGDFVRLITPSKSLIEDLLRVL